MSGVFSPGRAKIKERTLRTDKWWIEPAITFGVLFSFIIYATFRAFEGANYYKDHLISPFYSPCLSQACVPEATIFGFTIFGDGAAIKTVPLLNVLGAGVNTPFAMHVLHLADQKSPAMDKLYYYVLQTDAILPNIWVIWRGSQWPSG
jgi:hypothetical protein